MQRQSKPTYIRQYRRTVKLDLAAGHASGMRAAEPLTMAYCFACAWNSASFVRASCCFVRSCSLLRSMTCEHAMQVACQAQQPGKSKGQRARGAGPYAC